MALTQIRLDAQQHGSFLRRLEYFEKQVDRFDYPDLPFGDGKIVPFHTQNKPQYESFTYTQINGVGTFDLLRNYATSIPIVEIIVDEHSQRIHKWGSSYTYSDDDVRAFLLQGWNINPEKIYVVQEARRQKMNNLVAFGDPSIQMPGFVNHPAMLRSYSPSDIDRTSTPLEALQVMNDSVYAVVNLTNQVEKPNTLLIPLSRFNIISSRLIQTDSGGGMINKTILQHFLDSNPYIEEVAPLTELEGGFLESKGLGNKPIMIAYRRNPMKVRAKIFQPLTWLEPRRWGVDGWQRPCKFKFAGIEFRRPYSAHVVTLPNAF